MNLARLYIHRYVRLTAILAFVVLMSVTIYRHVNDLWFFNAFDFLGVKSKQIIN